MKKKFIPQCSGGDQVIKNACLANVCPWGVQVSMGSFLGGELKNLFSHLNVLNKKIKKENLL